MRTKNISEQAIQILEHEFKARSKGVFGRKKVFFETELNDSSVLRLTYESERKGLVSSVGQRVGSRIAGDVVQKQTAGTGVDSALGDAVRRSVSMQMEKGHRSNPVLRVVTRVDGKDAELVNFFAPEMGYRKNFSSADSDSTDIKHTDHTRIKRDYRPPTPEEEALYLSMVRDFVLKFRKGELEGDR
jgi:hypothetical protein